MKKSIELVYVIFIAMFAMILIAILSNAKITGTTDYLDSQMVGSQEWVVNNSVNQLPTFDEYCGW